MKKLQYFFGNKAFYKEMWVIAMPIALQQLISALVNILDSAMIGQWGVATLGNGGSEILSSAIMIANRFMTTIDNLMVMLAISCTIFIAQYFGAKQQEKMQQVFRVATLLTLSFGFISFLIAVFFAGDVIQFFATSINAGSAITSFGKQYLVVVSFSILLYAITVPITFSLRAIKITKIPLLASASAAMTNLILNVIMIYGLNLGLLGAAYATIIARLIELSILLYYSYRHRPAFVGNLSNMFAIPKPLTVSILKKGFPIIFAQIITEILGYFMFFVYARIDAGNATNIAAINLSMRVVTLVTAFVGGMGTAAIILVGSRLGAGQIAQAKQHARWQLSYISLVSLFTIFLMIGFTPLIQWIYNFNQETNALLSQVMLIQAFSLPFLFYAMNVIFITRSGGFTRAPILVTNLPYILLKVPLIVYFVYMQPAALLQLTFLQNIFGWLGLPLDFILAIFLLDKVIELIRALIAFFVYQYAPWQKDLTKSNNGTKLVIKDA
jgi:putative MATE family efflux protein